MKRLGVAVFVTLVVGVLLLRLATPADAVVTNFGIDFTGGGTSTSPAFTTPPAGAFGTFYGGDATGFPLANTVGTSIAPTLRFIFDTTALPAGATVTNFEIFFDGATMTGTGSAGERDRFDIELCDGNTSTSCTGTGVAWDRLDGTNKEFDSSSIPVAGPTFGVHTSGGASNLFMGADTSFFGEIENGFLLVQILRLQIPAILNTDNVNGANLQVEYTVTPEPTSMLLFGTTLAGLAAARRYLKRKTA